jgi:hypothetical protein
MSSVSRKHPFTSLFSPKMSRWCALSASDSAECAAGGASSAGLLADIAGCAQEVAECAGAGEQVSRDVQRAITECAWRY